MLFLWWIMVPGVVVGVIAAIIIACWVTRVWSPSEWRAAARIQRVERADFGDDDMAKGHGSWGVLKLLIFISVMVVVLLLALRVFAYCEANRWVDPLAGSPIIVIA